MLAKSNVNIKPLILHRFPTRKNHNELEKNDNLSQPIITSFPDPDP